MISSQPESRSQPFPTSSSHTASFNEEDYVVKIRWRSRACAFGFALADDLEVEPLRWGNPVKAILVEQTRQAFDCVPMCAVTVPSHPLYFLLRLFIALVVC